MTIRRIRSAPANTCMMAHRTKRCVDTDEKDVLIQMSKKNLTERTIQTLSNAATDSSFDDILLETMSSTLVMQVFNLISIY